MIATPLRRKIESFIRLSLEDGTVLDDIAQPVQHVGPRVDLIQEGDPPDAVNLILEGWACRYKTLEDGRRQIISFFLPGDMCDPYVFLFRAMDQSIGTLTPVKVARIPRAAIRTMTARSRDLAEALWWDMMVSMEIQREWTVSLGRRTATERLAHLICELAVRLTTAGLTDGKTFDLPITQADLGDALGLSTVHINRTLQELRASGAMSLRGRQLKILDEGRLQRMALFNPSYLHASRATRPNLVEAVD